MAEQYKFSVVSLGCAKNQVDAEIMLGLLKEAGYGITDNKEEADVIIVNTCGFIESAKTEAIEAILEAASYKQSAKCRAVIAAGCLTQRYASDVLEQMPEVDSVLGINGYDKIVEAVETAKHADTVFLVIGDCNTIGGGVPGKEKPEDMKDEITVGEGFDVHTLCLTPSQQKLFDSIIELDKPTILVFYGGRPYALKNEVEKVDAFMFCWGGGEQNGVAFANLIFGDKSPSAKLSVSFPQSVGHIPCYYNHKVSARGKYKNPGTPQTPGRDYVTSSPNAWLPFGYGLSYTTIKYSNLNATVLDNSEVSVSVDIENTGNYDIDETVLLYIRTVWCPITPFIKKLRRFEKVDIRKGEKKTVHFKLTRNDFTYIDEDFKTAYTTGEHKIIIEDLTCDIYL